MHVSGYNQELKTFANAHIPIFFSQYGCKLGTWGHRIFQETTAIHSPAMTAVFSGGIAYEFYDSPESRSGHKGYGLVTEEHAAAGKGVTKLPDFYNLKERLSKCKDAVVQEEVEGGPDSDSMERDFPPLSSHWKAGHAMPFTIADWDEVRRDLEEKVWMDVGDLSGTDLKLGHQSNIVRA